MGKKTRTCRRPRTKPPTLLRFKRKICLHVPSDQQLWSPSRSWLASRLGRAPKAEGFRAGRPTLTPTSAEASASSSVPRRTTSCRAAWAVTDAAVNSYHEVVPPAHFEKLLGRRALQDYNSIHAASQGNIGSGGPLGLWARSAGGAVTEAAMLAGEAGVHAVAPNIPIHNPDPEGNPFSDSG